ncbi:MAG: hypothetical protein IIB63_03150 [Proteobacteria bacterium]|nr:hypothetical protein [Pseudomonadota bacterium]
MAAGAAASAGPGDAAVVRIAVLTPDGKILVSTSETTNMAHFIDARTRKVVEKITFGIAGIRSEAIQPVGVRITGDGKLAFVALGPANRVAVIDAERFAVRKYLLVGQRVWQLAFSPDESKLFTTNGVSNDVSVIDVKRLKVVKSITVGRFPWGIVVK